MTNPDAAKLVFAGETASLVEGIVINKNGNIIIK